jgi:holo-[acyl-carrier protein] synthase
MILGVLLIMVKGIGVDLIDNIRFERLIDRFGDKIALKILSESELLEYQKTLSKSSYLSKKFAAKEALSKAIGSGLYRNGIFPKLITIVHTSLGKPFFEFSHEIRSNIQDKYQNIQLSITDTQTHSIAFVTVE